MYKCQGGTLDVQKAELSERLIQSQNPRRLLLDSMYYVGPNAGPLTAAMFTGRIYDHLAPHATAADRWLALEMAAKPAGELLNFVCLLKSRDRNHEAAVFS